MYANANGITGKIDSLKTAARTHNSHIITITETKIQGDMPKLEGYEWISKNRTRKEGGSIAIAVRNDLTNNATRVDDLEDQDQEVIWVEIRSGPQKQINRSVLWHPGKLTYRRDREGILATDNTNTDPNPITTKEIKQSGSGSGSGYLIDRPQSVSRQLGGGG